MQILDDIELTQVGGGSSTLQSELNPPSALDMTRPQGWFVGNGTGMIDQIATVDMPYQQNS